MYNSFIITAILILLLCGLIVFFIIRLKNQKHIKKQREYRTIILQSLTAIANAIDAKDSYTSGHSARVAAYSAEIARHMGKDNDFIENLYFIGLLHDVGKIGISDGIINKPDKLTDEEYEIMKKHTYRGWDILKDMTAIRNLTAGAAQHHEHWDGKGYFQGISGEKISLEARIIAAADTYDAMSSNRSYRKALPKRVILEEFERCKGKQFDPQIADIVIDMVKQNSFDLIDMGEIIDFKKHHTENTSGIRDGFSYELYRDSGNTAMTLIDGGCFKCEWSDVNVAIFRTGKRFDEDKHYSQFGEIKIDCGVNFRSDGCSVFSVTGWTVEPLVEYNIVESWGGSRPFEENDFKGTVEIDGGTYKIYELEYKETPTIKGVCDFKQYWSVRTEKRSGGIISVSEHFKVWEKSGMNLGKMYETTLAVKAHQSKGSAEVFRYALSVGDETAG